MECQPEKLVIAEVMQTRNEGNLDRKAKNNLKTYLVALHKKRDWSEDDHFREILSEDSVTQEDIDEEINEQKKKHGYAWQHKLEKILTYTPFQIFCLILAVIDVAIVIAVILLQLDIYKGKFLNAEIVYTETIEFINDKFKLHHLTDIHEIKLQVINFTCSDASSSPGGHEKPDDSKPPTPAPGPHKRFASNEVMMELRREKRSGGGGSLIRDSEDVIYMYNTEHNLHITSVAILAFFTILVFVKIAAEGLAFFKKVMEILDSLIVIVSFLLDVLILAMVINPEQADAAIVILLLWQIVRIFNGIMMMEIQRLEMRVKLLKRGKKKLKEKMDSFVEERMQKDREIESLQNLSKRKGATEDEVALCRPAKTLPKLNAHSGLGAIASISLGFSMQAPVELDQKAMKGKIKIQRQSDDFGLFLKDTLMFPDQNLTGDDVTKTQDGENDADSGKSSEEGNTKVGDVSDTNDADMRAHNGRGDGGGKLKRMGSVVLDEYNASPTPTVGQVTLDLGDAVPSLHGNAADESYESLSNTGLDKLKFGAGKSNAEDYDNLAFSSQS